MSARVTVKDQGAKTLLARARALRDGPRVRVGILDDSPKRDREGGSSKLSLAEIAALHEFGAPGANIPARSFLRSTADERAAEIATLQEKLGAKVLQGALDPTAALELLGAKVASMVQEKIAAGVPPPLKPRTVARKGSSKPLIDTGQLRSSVTWKVGGE